MKTLAIRLDDELHSQLQVLAQLAGTTITDEIRQAIDAHVTARRGSEELTQAAQGLLEEIERDAQSRRAALATLFGSDLANAAGSRPTSRKSVRAVPSDEKTSD